METTTERKSNKNLAGWMCANYDAGVTYSACCGEEWEAERTHNPRLAFERARSHSKRHGFAVVWMRDLNKFDDSRHSIVAEFHNGKRTK